MKLGHYSDIKEALPDFIKNLQLLTDGLSEKDFELWGFYSFSDKLVIKFF